MDKKMNIIQFSAQIEKCKANKDRTIDVTISTQELTPEDTANIFGYFEKQVWVAIAETPLTKSDLNVPEKLVEKGQKTPSQRLRSRMFAYFAETYGDKQNFEQFYENALEEIGQKYLSKLN